MDFSKLEELIKIPKKGDASKNKKQEYFDEMVSLLAEEGYSSNVEKYLMEGFSFCAVSPIIEFMKEKRSEDKNDIFDKIIKGKKFRSNEKGISFKISVNFLCQTINNYPEEYKIIETLIRDIPHKVKTKEGKMSSEASKVIEKYFIGDLSKNAILPDFSVLSLNPISVIEFCKLFSIMLEDITAKNDVNLININKVKKWISITPETKQATKNLNENDATNTNIKSAGTPEQTKKNKHLKSKELLDFAELLKENESRIEATAAHITSLEKENKILNSKVSNSYSRIESLEKDGILLTERISRKNSEYEQLMAEKSKISIELSDLRCVLAEKESEIAKILAEIEKQNSVLSVFTADKQSAQNEQLNAIASKLKAEYLDFKDALNIEMTVDLGENLRHQINAIFKILAKNGIDVEGR